MKHKILLDIDLHLFDGGAAVGDGAGDISGETQAGPAVAGQGKDTGGKRVQGRQRGRHGASPQTAVQPLQGGHHIRNAAKPQTAVLYGKQQAGPAPAGHEAGLRTGDPKASSPDAGEKVSELTESDTKAERQRRYRELINGEFKDLYTEDTQNIIDRRFKETKDLKRQVGKSQPIIDMLMDRYGIADGDTDKLLHAIHEDNAYWAKAAEEAGMSVEQYKRLQRLQRQNKELLNMYGQRRLQERMDRQILQWHMEGDELRKLYPGFDLKAESQEPRFLALLKSGVPVRHAYEVIHMGEIMNGVAQKAAKTAEKQVVAGIRAKGVRPAENGTAAQSGFTVKDDVSKLTRKDRAEIARRVARGEKIIF